MFQKGKAANPGGKPKSKVMTAHLKEMLFQPLGTIKSRAKPNKPGADEVVRQLILKAYKGDMGAIKEIFDRIDGKVAQAVIGGELGEPPVQVENITLKEVARRMAFVLLSAQQPEDGGKT